MKLGISLYTFLYITRSVCFLTLNNKTKMKVFFKSSQKYHGPPCRYKSQALCTYLFTQLLNKLNGPLPEYESRAPVYTNGSCLQVYFLHKLHYIHTLCHIHITVHICSCTCTYLFVLVHTCDCVIYILVQLSTTLGSP